MPELPEVETVRRGLELQVGRFPIGETIVCRSRAVAAPKGDPDGFTAALRGCELAGWRRRGKYLVAKLERDGAPAGELGVQQDKNRIQKDNYSKTTTGWETEPKER